ncbi:MAG: response regulator [bacterium]|nr:response regulator [bacterium]
MGKTKILVVDDEEDIATVLREVLHTKGYEVIVAREGREAIDRAMDERPDIILLDVMLPGISGYEVCKCLKENRLTHLIPIVMITAKHEVNDKVTGIGVGADDYLTKPFIFAELEARIEGILRSTRYKISTSPLTGLPGNVSIEEEIKKRMASGERFAVCQLDVDNFKAYNDKYGYDKGDEVIRFIAKVLIKVLDEYGDKRDFISHIGGDDFILVISPSRVDKICSEIISEFDKRIPLRYNEKDRKRGYIESLDRQGNLQKFPIMSISISCVTNEKRHFTHYAQVTEIITELKKYAKQHKGSIYVKERRE